MVVEDSSLSKLERMQKAQEALWGIWVPVDVVIFTKKEFDELKKHSYSIVSTVLKEGHLIHAA